jgi:hypothetical protein
MKKNKGINNTGTENYGGAVVTASGLLFIATTKDGKFRVFDKKQGKSCGKQCFLLLDLLHLQLIKLMENSPLLLLAKVRN